MVKLVRKENIMGTSARDGRRYGHAVFVECGGKLELGAQRRKQSVHVRREGLRCLAGCAGPHQRQRVANAIRADRSTDWHH